MTHSQTASLQQSHESLTLNLILYTDLQQLEIKLSTPIPNYVISTNSPEEMDEWRRKLDSIARLDRKIICGSGDLRQVCGAGLERVVVLSRPNLPNTALFVWR